jgi:hypothetical protein
LEGKKKVYIFAVPKKRVGKAGQEKFIERFNNKR